LRSRCVGAWSSRLRVRVSGGLQLWVEAARCTRTFLRGGIARLVGRMSSRVSGCITWNFRGRFMANTSCHRQRAPRSARLPHRDREQDEDELVEARHVKLLGVSETSKDYFHVTPCGIYETADGEGWGAGSDIGPTSLSSRHVV
jgi:hypothetical protein